MKQKVVIRVTMNGKKSRSKVLKIAVGVSGVQSVSFTGKELDQVEVVGEGIDAVALTSLLRKNVGHADLVLVASAEKKEEKKEETKKSEPVPVWNPSYHYPLIYQYPDNRPDSCSIM